MHFFKWLSPSFISGQISQIEQSIEQEKQHNPRSKAQENTRAWIVIGVSCLCLLLVHYGKYSVNFFALIQWLDTSLNLDGQWVNFFRHSDYRQLYGYIWWGGINCLGFLIIPMLTIRLLLKDPLRQYGWQWGQVHKHWPGYMLLTLPIICFAIIASYDREFTKMYPFYDNAHRSLFDFLAWEVIYILQFIAVEFFFRGYLVNGLRRQFGSLSIAVMCLPYLMLHFPKLWPESFGAILFGFFLGILALMSRSIWGGVFVHVSIALTMDIAALIQTKGLNF